MIALEAHAEGVILPVRAQPGSRRNEFRGEQEGMLKVCVTTVPEKGKANKAVIELLAKSLKLRKSQIVLLSGRDIASETVFDSGYKDRRTRRKDRRVDKRMSSVNAFDQSGVQSFPPPPPEDSPSGVQSLPGSGSGAPPGAASPA